LSNGYVDTFRHLHPKETDCYTFWSRRSKTARANNTGWRLDYFVASQNLIDEERITASYNRRFVEGSDHCPIGIHLKTNIAKNDNENEDNN